MGDFHNLEVWRRSSDFSIALHLAARNFSRCGAPGLKAQVLRAVGSIPSNIAEGARKGSDREFARFVCIAIGSANECENHLLLARGLACLPDAQLAALLAELEAIRKMLFGLLRRLRGSE
ncbi:MAG: four helix bundle protein [Steroidobacteraceae bacterium]